jgi:hypothetical protein
MWPQCLVVYRWRKGFQLSSRRHFETTAILRRFQPEQLSVAGAID